MNFIVGFVIALSGAWMSYGLDRRPALWLGPGMGLILTVFESLFGNRMSALQVAAHAAICMACLGSSYRSAARNPSIFLTLLVTLVDVLGALVLPIVALAWLERASR